MVRGCVIRSLEVFYLIIKEQEKEKQMNEKSVRQKGAQAFEVQNDVADKEPENHAKVHDGEFVDYVVSILGLKENTARSYDKYVWKASEKLSEMPERVVSSDESLREAIVRLFDGNQSEKTVSNWISGLKAYFLYKNGRAYEDGGCDKNDTNRIAPDIPHELLAQINDLELKLQEREDALIGRVFQVVLLVLTIGPALVAGSNCPRAVLWGFKCAMLCGAFGLFFLFPVLRRSSRQLKELVAYGKKLRAGEVACLEFDPSDKTMFERVFSIMAGVFLFGSFVGIFVAIMRIGS